MKARTNAHIAETLSCEWERIELLAHLLAESRQGGQAMPGLMERLQQLQDKVKKNRHSGRGWDRIAPITLHDFEKDILACAIAPEVMPGLGWMFQSLQAGSAQPYPTPVFLQELLAIAPHEAPALYSALSDSSALRHHNLIEVEETGPFSPIRPAPGVTARLLGQQTFSQHLPGATPVKIAPPWGQLVLPADRIEMLNEFLFWVKHRDTVVHKWGGNDSGGPVALFAGPSGTGKTFAAAVIAAELGWPLYRVDLGCLVSKYIGETEKNLNRLFDAAHGRPLILQFDEADSLFGKRGKIKEARDRYANMEVSHLLARIEAHHGPVILTTNLRNHLDPAFARRFQLVVDFPRPDTRARTRLWQLLLPPQAPYHPEVDPAFLGAAVNLTGGGIHNAALHAAYLAAGRKEPVSLRHIAIAVWRELGKDGRELSLSDLGPLARFFPQEGIC